MDQAVLAYNNKYTVITVLLIRITNQNNNDSFRDTMILPSQIHGLVAFFFFFLLLPTGMPRSVVPLDGLGYPS